MAEKSGYGYRWHTHPANQFCTDSTTGITKLVNEILQKGKRKMGFLGDYECFSTFHSAMTLAGVPVDETFCIKSNSTDMDTSLAALPELPEMFICANDFIAVDVMQCGLNWNMMIQKREIFRACFDDFDFDKVAVYGETDIERIMGTDGMIRSRRKSGQSFTMRNVFRRYGRSLVHSTSTSGDLPRERLTFIWAARKEPFQPGMVCLTGSVPT